MISKRGTVVRLHNLHESYFVWCFFNKKRTKKLSEINNCQVVSEHARLRPRQPD